MSNTSTPLNDLVEAARNFAFQTGSFPDVTASRDELVRALAIYDHETAPPPEDETPAEGPTTPPNDDTNAVTAAEVKTWVQHRALRQTADHIVLRTATARDNVVCALAVFDYTESAAPVVDKTGERVWDEHARLRIAANDIVQAWKLTRDGEECIPERMFRRLEAELDTLIKGAS